MSQKLERFKLSELITLQNNKTYKVHDGKHCFTGEYRKTQIHTGMIVLEFCRNDTESPTYVYIPGTQSISVKEVL
ncbi:hypothetical protein OsccyDRAFT_0664 [Leptolyngbyaceae cyanobacterium JSC-12]|nr:hypothetical protein OsccyDRAFT_0664 [Leptolyngbyaceae cyanobacterium JSC-12]